MAPRGARRQNPAYRPARPSPRTTGSPPVGVLPRTARLATRAGGITETRRRLCQRGHPRTGLRATSVARTTVGRAAGSTIRLGVRARGRGTVASAVRHAGRPGPGESGTSALVVEGIGDDRELSATRPVSTTPPTSTTRPGSCSRSATRAQAIALLDPAIDAEPESTGLRTLRAWAYFQSAQLGAPRRSCPASSTSARPTCGRGTRSAGCWSGSRSTPTRCRTCGSPR